MSVLLIGLAVLGALTWAVIAAWYLFTLWGEFGFDWRMALLILVWPVTIPALFVIEIVRDLRRSFRS